MSLKTLLDQMKTGKNREDVHIGLVKSRMNPYSMFPFIFMVLNSHQINTSYSTEEFQKATFSCSNFSLTLILSLLGGDGGGFLSFECSAFETLWNSSRLQIVCQPKMIQFLSQPFFFFYFFVYMCIIFLDYYYFSLIT